jgi:hypothetical protein
MLEMEQFEFLNNMVEDERAYIFRIPTFWKRMIGLVLAASIIWGSIMKGLIYSHFQRMERFIEKPINVLIVMDMLIHHFAVAVFAIQYLFVLVLDSTVIQFLKNELQIDIDEQVSSVLSLLKNLKQIYVLIIQIQSNLCTAATPRT